MNSTLTLRRDAAGLLHARNAVELIHAQNGEADADGQENGAGEKRTDALRHDGLHRPAAGGTPVSTAETSYW